jgi:protein-S-isoprenylcysteine O-methyltransferase Ste14
MGAHPEAAGDESVEASSAGDSARGVTRTALLVGALLFARWDPACAITGGALLLLGLVLRIVSKGHLRRRRRLVTSGPFSRVRNPFYLGNLAVDAGLLVFAGLPWAVPLYGALFLFVYASTVRAEEITLRRLHGAEFETYAAAVGRWWPRLTAFTGGDKAGFRWRTVLREKEGSRSTRILAYPGLIALRAWHLPALDGTAAAFAPPMAATWGVIGGVVVLVVASRVIARRER